MDVDSLRYFLKVTQGDTLADIAADFGVSQPSVSRALHRLDDMIGEELLQRSGRHLVPTRVGQAFAVHLEVGLGHIDRALAEVRHVSGIETGTVRLAYQPSLGAWLVPEMVSSFRKPHPQVHFELTHVDDDDATSLLLRGEVDLIFTAQVIGNEDVDWEWLITQRLGVAMPASHPWAERDSMQVADLAEQDIIMLQPSWELRTIADRLLGAAGVDPQIVFEAPDLPTTLGLVATGLGMAIAPSSSRRPRGGTRGTRVVPLQEPEAQRVLGVAWADRPSTAAAEAFRRHVLLRAAHYPDLW